MIIKTAPYAHQKIAYQKIHDRSSYALLMEMGTGKTWVVLVDAANRYMEGNIEILIIVAPNGVHRNWIINEVPDHLPLNDEQHVVGFWSSTESVAQREMREIMLGSDDRLKIFAMNAEALGKEGEAKKFLNSLIKKHRVYFVVDEANEVMKSPKAKRTRTLVSASKNVKGYIIMKCILTGTPVTQGPFDLFAPFKFLDPEILGYSTFTGFKYEFGIFKTMEFVGRKSFQMLVKHKNLDKLKELIKPHSYRVLKKDCLDLPRKVREIIYVDMSAEQSRVYRELRDDYFTEITTKLNQRGMIEVSMALTRILRLQQVVGGFVPVELQDRIEKVKFEPNPKIARTKSLIDSLPRDEGVIIWCRFTDEIKALVVEFKDEAVAYYGGVSDDDKEKAVIAFQSRGIRGAKRIFIANQQCAGLGLTLTRASTVIYFSNNFSYANRVQSEDRCHRIGQKKTVTYIDLITPDSVDEKILKALRDKKDMADYITGDEVSEWM